MEIVKLFRDHHHNYIRHGVTLKWATAIIDYLWAHKGRHLSAATFSRIASYHYPRDVSVYVNDPEFLLSYGLAYEVWEDNSKLSAFNAMLDAVNPRDTWKVTAFELIEKARRFTEEIRAWKAGAAKRLQNLPTGEQRAQLRAILESEDNFLTAKRLGYRQIWCEVFRLCPEMPVGLIDALAVQEVYRPICEAVGASGT